MTANESVTSSTVVDYFATALDACRADVHYLADGTVVGYLTDESGEQLVLSDDLLGQLRDHHEHA